MSVEATTPWVMLEEIRLLLRELVLLGGGDPESIAPEQPPWERSRSRPEDVVEF